jgi:hypothetical protein
MQNVSPIEHFQNATCSLCAPDNRRGGRTHFFPISPKSMQTLKKSRTTDEFRAAIRQIIEEDNLRSIGAHKGERHALNVHDPLGLGHGPITRQVCVGLLFCLSRDSQNSDVDNMAKSFLDAIQGPTGLITNDMEVVHLEVIKVRGDDSQGMIGLRIINASTNFVM